MKNPVHQKVEYPSAISRYPKALVKAVSKIQFVCAMGSLVLLYSFYDYGLLSSPFLLLTFVLLGAVSIKYDQAATAMFDVFLLLCVVTSVVLERGPIVSLFRKGGIRAKYDTFTTLNVMLLLCTLSSSVITIVTNRLRLLVKENQDLVRLRTFYYQVATHDLRGPASVILSDADSEDIWLCAASMLRTIDNVLWMYRQETYAEMQDPVTVPGDFWKEGCHRIAVALAKQKEIDLTWDQQDVPRLVRVDAGKLEQIIFNLVSNAIKYTRTKGFVSVRLAGIPPEKPDILTVSVRDTGVGISDKDLLKIFDAFYRVKAADRLAKGFGIGLSIVAALAKCIRAEVKVESEVGKGTTFLIRVPITVPEADVESGNVLYVDLRKILISEDSLGNRKILSRMIGAVLQSEEEVDCAVDGQDTMDKLEEGSSCMYDILFLDLGLPIISGTEIVSRIHRGGDRLPRYRNLKVVIISASPDPVVLQSLREKGCHFAPKPFRASVLSGFLVSENA